jgi:hypothetical protein
MSASGKLRRLAFVTTDVSEERIAYLQRASVASYC